MRALLALIAWPLLATFAPAAMFRPAPIPGKATIAFESVPLDASDPSRRRIGDLLYLGGWAIRSNDPRFGGISSMHVRDGAVTALSDAGQLLRFPVPGTGRQELSIAALPDGPGTVDRKKERDSEAMTVHGDHAWVAFERHNAVWRYRLADWRSDSAARPEAMRGWRSNSGGEGIIRLPDGRFLIFAEARQQPDGVGEVALFDGDPAVQGTPSRRIFYRPPAGYRVTDAALLPDGRMLLLNRRFTPLEGVSAKLTVAPVAAWRAGAVIEPREIAFFQAPVTVDNMEALSVTREAGRTIVWIASDDNFSGLQRTLLLKFAMAPDARKEAGKIPAP